MAFYSGQTSIGTAATVVDGVLIGSNGGNPYRLMIHNNDNTDAVYIGGSAVTTTNGLKLDKGVMLQLTVSPTDLLYAVSTKNGAIGVSEKFTEGRLKIVDDNDWIHFSHEIIHSKLMRNSNQLFYNNYSWDTISKKALDSILL